MTIMTPREITSELDKHIVGQDKAKRAVAIAQPASGRAAGDARRRLCAAFAFRGVAAVVRPDGRPPVQRVPRGARERAHRVPGVPGDVRGALRGLSEAV